MEILPWPELTVVSIGSVPAVRQEAEERQAASAGGILDSFGSGLAISMVTGSFPIYPLRPERAIAVYKEVREEGVLVHLAFVRLETLVEIRPREFNYEYLGERRAPTSRENFALLLGDLARLSAGARWTVMARVFLETGVLRPDFRDADDLLGFTAWIAAWTAAAPGGTEA